MIKSLLVFPEDLKIQTYPSEKWSKYAYNKMEWKEDTAQP